MHSPNARNTENNALIVRTYRSRYGECVYGGCPFELILRIVTKELRNSRDRYEKADSQLATGS